MKISVDQLKKELGADVVLTNGHYLLTSKIDGARRHTETYVQKDELFSNSPLLFYILGIFAKYFCNKEIKVIIGPASGGNKLSIMMANKLLEHHKEIYAPQTRKTDDNFIISGGEKYIPDANVLIVEDIITSGTSVKKLQKIIQLAGGKIMGIACIVNRGNAKAIDFNLEKDQFFALYNVDIPDWATKDCSQEILSRPISKKYGVKNGC